MLLQALQQAAPGFVFLSAFLARRLRRNAPRSGFAGGPFAVVVLLAGLVPIAAPNRPLARKPILRIARL